MTCIDFSRLAPSIASDLRAFQNDSRELVRDGLKPTLTQEEATALGSNLAYLKYSIYHYQRSHRHHDRVQDIAQRLINGLSIAFFSSQAYQSLLGRLPDDEIFPVHVSKEAFDCSLWIIEGHPVYRKPLATDRARPIHQFRFGDRRFVVKTMEDGWEAEEKAMHSHALSCQGVSAAWMASRLLATPYSRYNAKHFFSHPLDKTQNNIRAFVHQLLTIFAQLHGKKIIHRDMKLRNVLIDSTGYSRLIDFGLAQIKGERASNAGSISKAAPESSHHGPVSPAEDVWGLGIAIWETLTTEDRFFRDSSSMEWGDYTRFISNIEQDALDHRVDEVVDLDLRNLLQRMIRKDPAERITAIDALSHPYFTKDLPKEG